MTAFQVEVRVMPRPTLLDPQGQAVHHALTALGFEGVEGVRVGKALSLTVEARDAEGARQAAVAMCEKLIANPITEDFTLTVGAAT